MPYDPVSDNYSVIGTVSSVAALLIGTWGTAMMVEIDPKMVCALAVTLSIVGLSAWAIWVIRVETEFKKLQYIRLLHVFLVQELDPEVGPYTQATYSHVDELIDAGFPEESYIHQQNLFDSARIIDSLGYKKGLKKIQEKYG